MQNIEQRQVLDTEQFQQKVIEIVKADLEKQIEVVPEPVNVVVHEEKPEQVEIVKAAVQQPVVEKEKKLPRLMQVWHRASEYVKKHDYESAYRLILAEGDDMYLLRLVV